MADEEISDEEWRAWIKSQVHAGHIVNMADWLDLRLGMPEVMAKIEALPSERGHKVIEAVERVLREWRRAGKVSEEANRRPNEDNCKGTRSIRRLALPGPFFKA